MVANVVGLVSGPNVKECIHKDHHLCEVLEVRLDTFSENNWTDLVKLISVEFPETLLLITCRLERDGGSWPSKKSKERSFAIKALLDLCFEEGVEVDYLDFEIEEVGELHIIKPILEKANIELLLSHHNFNQSYTQSELEIKHTEMMTAGADCTKFALMYTCGADIVEAQKFVSSAPKGLRACFGMGDLGKQSRLLHPLLGGGAANWTYGFVGDKPSAPGQISIQEMHDFFGKLD
jgi:3-dehydroquinate dehydratase-1